MNFPDPNVTTEYESPDGLKYVWNGFAWEITCGGTDLSGLVTKEEFTTDQERQDDEFKYDQDRQDKELEDYKKEVEADQDRQDAEIAQLKNNALSTDLEDRVDNSEQLQRDLHLIVSEGIYENPSFQIDGQLPNVGQWIAVRGQGTADQYEEITAVRLSQTAGIHSHLEHSRNGDYMFIQHLGTDAGGKYKITANWDNTGGPNGHYLFYVEFIEGFTEGTIERPGFDQIQIARPKQLENLWDDQERQDDEWAKDQKRQDDALADEIKAREEQDLLHEAEINTLEYKLEALVGLTFRGTYEFKIEEDCQRDYEQCIEQCIINDPGDTSCHRDCGDNLVHCESDKVRPGFFEAVDPSGEFDNLQQIVLSKNDKSGVEIDWSGVLDAGDYLEVDHVFQGQLDKTNYGLYRITDEPDETTNSYGEAVYTMKLQFLQGDGVLNPRELYEIRGITAAEGINPEELGDFLTKEEAATLYSLKTHDHDDLTTTVAVHSTVTLSSGNNAKVTNMGDTKNANFKFEIPKGANGTNGTNGTNGSKGADGKDLVMSTGTSTSPSLSKGQMYLNTTQKVLYIGVT